MAKKRPRAQTVFSWHWRCDRCGNGGAVRLPSHVDGWSGAMAVLEAHRARAPRCRGGVRTVRVSGPRRRTDREAR
jgi:hypothetical protein